MTFTMKKILYIINNELSVRDIFIKFLLLPFYFCLWFTILIFIINAIFILHVYFILGGSFEKYKSTISKVVFRLFYFTD